MIGHAVRSFGGWTELGAEYLYWKTQYRALSPGVANRFDLHLSVLF